MSYLYHTLKTKSEIQIPLSSILFQTVAVYDFSKIDRLTINFNIRTLSDYTWSNIYKKKIILQLDLLKYTCKCF